MERFQYKEAGPQLLLQAFLQRIVNSGGRIEREYGLPHDETLRQGLRQTRACMDRCAAAEGHRVIFDRVEGKAWDQKIFRREEASGGSSVTVWGM